MSTILPGATQRDVRRDAQAPKSFNLRCVISRSKDGTYRAECIDLDIVAKAASESEAETKLKDAVKGYLTVAFAGDPSGLLPRPSPWLHRARYHLLSALASVLSTAKRSFRIMEISSECVSHP